MMLDGYPPIVSLQAATPKTLKPEFPQRSTKQNSPIKVAAIHFDDESGVP